MKNGFGKIILAAPCGLMLCLNTQAKASTDNPYAPIIDRNAFALNALPDPKNETVVTQPSALPKITIQGFMHLLGKPNVLFKISLPAVAGQPAMDIPCILCEGEQQADVQLVRIDWTAGVVIFNNHGTVQEIPLRETQLRN